MEAIHIWQEFVDVSFKNELQLNVVSLGKPQIIASPIATPYSRLNFVLLHPILRVGVNYKKICITATP